MKPKGTEARLGLAMSGTSFQSGNIAERLREARQGIRGINLIGLDFGDGDRTRVMLTSLAGDLTSMLPPHLNRWGFFAKGTVGYGDQKDNEGGRGYDYTASGITVGSDYRFRDSFISGLTLGYNYARADLDDAGSKVKLGSYTLGVCGTYYRNNF
jgi:outer membrane autotransporter protein